MKLREYQKEAIGKGLTYFNSSAKFGVLMILPTGAGKSIIIGEMATRVGGHTLILQPNSIILNQNKRKIESKGFSVGVFSASSGGKNIKRITLATIGSIMNSTEKFKHFDRIIIDECHLVNPKSGMYKDFFEIYKGKIKILGLTATPYRQYSNQFVEPPIVEHKFLTRTRPRVFKEIIHITEVSELLIQGFIPPINYIVSSQNDVSKLKNNSTGSNFTDESLSWFFKKNKIGNRIVAGILRTKKEHKNFLVFVSFVEEAEIVTRELNSKKIASATVSAKTLKKDLDKILNDFFQGKLKVVVNVGKLIIGFDFPDLECIVDAQKTRSLGRHYQKIGRLMRISRTAKRKVFYDMVGNTEELGRPADYRLLDLGGGKYVIKDMFLNKILTKK